MAVVGLAGDVNNSIFTSNVYPFGRSYGMLPKSGSDFAFRNNYSGELGGLNQDFQGGSVMLAANTTNPAIGNSGPMAGYAQNGAMSANGTNQNGPQPAHWWITFAILFIVIAWAARRFAPDGEQFAIIRPNLINGVFLTLWIVLILAFLKQVAIRTKHIPLIGTLSELILSV